MTKANSPGKDITSRCVEMVFAVDCSGSMGNEHRWLQNLVEKLEEALNLVGIGTGADSNQYGLVGFTSGNQRHTYQVGNGLLGSSSDLVGALGNLPTTGDEEDGYAAMDQALQYPFRPGASINVILVTDEDRDNTESALTYESMLENFTQAGALINAVVDLRLQDADGEAAVGFDGNGNAYTPDGNGGFTESSGGSMSSGAGTTKADYADLALATKSRFAVGAVWDVEMLRKGGAFADSFSKAFTKVKVQEVASSLPIILYDQGTFEVPAASEAGVQVITAYPEGGDYEFVPSGNWSPGEGDYTADGDASATPGDTTYPTEGNNSVSAYALAAEDTQFGSVYQITRTPQISIHGVEVGADNDWSSRDHFIFRMNDVKNQYLNNSGTIVINYEYKTPI